MEKCLYNFIYVDIHRAGYCAEKQLMTLCYDNGWQVEYIAKYFDNHVDDVKVTIADKLDAEVEHTNFVEMYRDWKTGVSVVDLMVKYNLPQKCVTDAIEWYESLYKK